MGHWRDFASTEAEGAYKMMDDGAALVKATSTKYTLLGTISVEDGSKLSNELKQGCELIATGALTLHSPLLSCIRSTRHYAVKYARPILVTVITLISSFTGGKTVDEGDVSRKTGAVWDACDALVERCPRGNRNCSRRELFTWVGDCNGTMDEFQELIEAGPRVVDSATTGLEDKDEEWDRFCSGNNEEDRYSEGEMPIVTSALALVKCSRGVLNLILKACESAAIKVEEEGGEKERLQGIWQWISDLQELAIDVGEGVTDLGMAMYPPIDLRNKDGERRWEDTTLGKEVIRQKECLLCVIGYVMTDESCVVELSEEVKEMVSKLRAAVGVRVGEIETGLTAGLQLESEKT